MPFCMKILLIQVTSALPLPFEKSWTQWNATICIRREDYLEAIGLRDSFRWGAKQDANVTHNPDVLFPDFDVDRGNDS